MHLSPLYWYPLASHIIGLPALNIWISHSFHKSLFRYSTG